MFDWGKGDVGENDWVGGVIRGVGVMCCLGWVRVLFCLRVLFGWDVVGWWEGNGCDEVNGSGIFWFEDIMWVLSGRKEFFWDYM